MKHAALALLSLALLGGCASSTEERLKAEAKAGCPQKQTREVMAARRMVESLRVGEDSARALRNGPAPVKTMALLNPHEAPLTVYFYKTALPSCSVLQAESTHVPVIAEPGRKGKIKGFGRETLDTLIAQGWDLAYNKGRWFGQQRYSETPWPWQSWDYTYIPRN